MTTVGLSPSSGVALTDADIAALKALPQTGLANSHIVYWQHRAYRYSIQEDGTNIQVALGEQQWQEVDKILLETLTKVQIVSQNAFTPGIREFTIDAHTTDTLTVHYSTSDHPNQEFPIPSPLTGPLQHQARNLVITVQSLNPQDAAFFAPSASPVAEAWQYDELIAEKPFSEQLDTACRDLRRRNTSMESTSVIFAAKGLSAQSPTRCRVIDDNHRTIKATHINDPGPADGHYSIEHSEIIRAAIAETPAGVPIFIPIHKHGHYTLLYRSIDSAWHYYDSKNSPDTQVLILALQRLISPVAAPGQPPQPLLPITTEEAVDRELQGPEDSTNCGAYVIRKIHLVLSPQLDQSRSITEYRTRFAQNLSDAYSLPKLLQQTRTLDNALDPANFVHFEPIAPPAAAVPVAGLSPARISIYDGDPADYLCLEGIDHRICCHWTGAPMEQLKIISQLGCFGQPIPDDTFVPVNRLRNSGDDFYRPIPEGTEPWPTFDVHTITAPALDPSAFTPAEQLTEAAQSLLQKNIYTLLYKGPSIPDATIIIPEYPSSGLNDAQKQKLHQFIAVSLKNMLTTHFYGFSGKIVVAIGHEPDGQNFKNAYFQSFRTAPDGFEYLPTALPVALCQLLDHSGEPIPNRALQRT